MTGCIGQGRTVESGAPPERNACNRRSNPSIGMLGRSWTKS